MTTQYSQQGNEFRVNTYATGDQSSPSITSLADGGFVATWNSLGQDGDGYGVYGQVYGGDGTSVGSEFRVNTYTTGGQSSPSIISLADGSFVVTWVSDGQDGDGSGVYGQVYGSNGTPVGSEFRVNTYTAGYQNGPTFTSLAGGDFVVTWISNGQDGDGYGVYGQVYGGDGTSVGSEFRVNTYTTGGQSSPSIISLADGSFVVTLVSDGQDGDGSGVYGQVYGGDGSPVGSDFRVNTYTTGHQHGSSITSLAGGDFVVAWISNGQDGSDAGVYGQIYGGDGSPVGSEFRISTYTISDQNAATITSLADGGFVVTWQSWGQNGSNFGVYGQVYGGNGTPVGSEFRVDAHTVSFLLGPSVTNLAGGGFVVTWSDDSQDTPSTDVYGQVYGSDGSPVGSEFRVNTYATSDQVSQSITSLVGGGFVVTWNSYGQDGSDYGVYGQIFSPSNNSVPSGMVEIVGVSLQGQVLSANTAGVTDADGVNATSLAYQWLRNGSDITGATNSTYTLTQADVGSAISVRYSYTDNFGTHESVTSDLTPLVQNVNDAPFISAGSIGDGFTNVPSPGGGYSISVEGSLGENAKVLQTGTIFIQYAYSGVNPVVYKAFFGESADDFAKWTEGVDITQYVSLTGSQAGQFIIVAADAGISNQDITISVTSVETEWGLHYVAPWYGVGIDISHGSSLQIIGSASEGKTLSFDPSYISDPDGIAATIPANFENAPPATRLWTITGVPIRVSDIGTTMPASSFDGGGFDSVTINLDGSLTFNGVDTDIAYLASQIGYADGTTHSFDGSVTHFELMPDALVYPSTPYGEYFLVTPDLAQSIWGLTLDEAVKVPDFSYQWLRDGQPIDGATGQRHTLTQADVGSAISVRVSYTDDFGAHESVTSELTPLVQNVNDAASGSVLVNGIPTQGQVLSANITGVTDADGLNAATIAYQWLRNGSVIANATSSTYTLTMADIGSAISVRYSYTDNFGTNETVTSAATALIQQSIFNGTAAADVLTGNVYDNSIYGFAGNDSLYGGSGNDLLNGGDGNDILDGGAGVDTIEYTGTAAIKIDLTVTAKQITGQGSDTITNIENITSSSGNDVLRGNTLDNTFRSGAGNDQLFGAAGNDSLYADLGNDTLQGDAGNDLLDGGAGIDTLVYTGSLATTVDLMSAAAQNTGQGWDTIIDIENVTTGAGADVLSGNLLANVLTSGDGNDQLTGYGGADTLYGGLGNDTFIGEFGDGNDVIDGGAGVDTLAVSSGSLTVDFNLTTAQVTGFGTDKVLNMENITSGGYADVLRGNSVANLFLANGGNDLLTGGAGNDSLFGGGEADTLQGDAGNDLLDGGNGVDTALFLGSTAVKVDLNITQGQSTGIGTDTLLNIENVTSGSGADVLKGNAVDNVLTSGAGNDTLYGFAGNDALYGGDGNDVISDGTGTDIIDGGNGIDTFTRDLSADYSAYAFRAVVDLSSGKFYAEAAPNDFDTLISIENVDMTGSFDDIIIGTAGANSLKSGIGRDLLYGGDGNDTLIGGADSDTLEGGAGSDSLDGGLGNDSILFGTGDDSIYAGDGDDIIDDIAGTQVLGNNLIYGGAGNDSVWAGDGRDTIYGGAGNDTLTADAGNDLIYGDEGNDTLVGVSGNDSLYGGIGNDWVEGGAGNDALYGGAGADVFIFNVGDGSDKVYDFLNGTDRFQIGTGAEAFSDVRITDSGTNVLIQFSDVSITLVNVDHTLIGADDFLFV